MTSKQLAHQVRLSEWAQLMRTRRESGLTIRSWCANNGINEKTYYYWQKKLRHVACSQISDPSSGKTGLIPTGWSQVSTVAESEETIPETLAIEIGSSRIHATKSTDVDLLAKVCRVMMSLC